MPYGAWPSSITAASLVEGAVGISEAMIDRERIVWAESRPSEGGRTALMSSSVEGASFTEPVEITPPDANVRTLVHEYGGGAWWLGEDCVYRVDVTDQRLRRIDPDGTETLITPEPPAPRAHRYADGRVTPDGRWSICVRERHATEGEPVNEIVAVANDGSGVVSLWAGADFVSSPRVSPAGDRLTFISWNHPEMPWTKTTLHVFELGDAALGEEILELSGDRSFCEPGWVGEELHVVVDDDEWWNLFRVDLDDGTLTGVVTGPFEIGAPPWVFGMQRWAVVDGVIVSIAGLPTGDELIVSGRTITTVDSSMGSLHASGSLGVYVGAGYDHNSEVIALRLVDGVPQRTPVSRAKPLAFERGLLVEPEWISYPTGSSADTTAYALYYPPTNPACLGPDDERPPLLVLAHGGPTVQARRQLQSSILYWTSRGIAVVDVDYRGSTGYGRTFRQALDGQWGIADVEDCIAAAEYLATRRDVDPGRLMIRGGSAGGFTVLSALTFHDTFAVGACRYGVADLEALATDTHKFESRYLDSLVGEYPAAKAIYVDRSPIHHVDKLDTPMIVLQGDEDEIVPPNQSEMIVDALRAKNVLVEYLLFEGEQHGFRKSENIVTALEAEIAFFGRVLGFRPT